MNLDVTTQPVIDPLIWHTFPDEKDGIMSDEIWKCGPLVCTLLKNPACRNGEQLVAIPYAMVVKRMVLQYWLSLLNKRTSGHSLIQWEYP